MKKVIALLSLALISFSSQAQTKILFLGNSYTGVNNLPAMFYNLALETGDTVIFDSNTPGGYTFNGHSTNSTTLNKIASNDWDFVVLQEQSQIPSFSPGQVANDCYPFAAVLVDSIRANNPCTEPLFYMTWGRKFGDQNNCQFWPPVCTYEGMQGQLRRSYLELANIHNATVSPAGMAWHTARQNDSIINLYTADNSHPSIHGTYLTACTFFATIYRTTPVGLNYVPSGISQNEATFLQEMAALTVLDSLDQWRIGANDVVADFDWATNGASVQFNDLSIQANSYFWDFGDGNTSNDANPGHVYGANGTYDVQLIVSSPCGTDTASSSITVTVTAIEEQDGVNSFTIYPNPAQNHLTMRGNWSTGSPLLWSIQDLAGRVLHSGILKDLQGDFVTEFDLSELPVGTYLLNMNGESVQRTHRFVKL